MCREHDVIVGKESAFVIIFQIIAILFGMHTANLYASECDKTAITASRATKAHTLKKAIIFQTAPRLVFYLPSSIQKIVHSLDFVHLVYRDKSLVSFQVVRSEDYGVLPENVVISNIPSLLFEHTCNDLKKTLQKHLYKRLEEEKRDYLTGVNTIEKLRKGKLDLYIFSRSGRHGREQYAFVVNRMVKNSFQIVMARHMSRLDFKDLVLSIETR